MLLRQLPSSEPVWGDAAGDAAAESKAGEIDKIVLLGAEGGDSPEGLTCDKLFILSRDERSGSGPRMPGISAAYQKSITGSRLN
jgi:hypothetical protein